MRTSLRARHVAPDLSVFVVTSGCDPGSPANGGLRLLPYRSDGAALADARRLAALMARKHSLYGTGFSGGKVVARAADPRTLKQRVLQVTALLLESLGGSMVTGCDLNTGREDMERLVRWTPHVLAAVGSRIDPSACTAHGVLGAMAALRPRPGSALVHGCGAVGGVVARGLVEAGWRVWTVDRDDRRAALPGARALDPDGPWWRQAEPEQVYGFVRAVVLERTRRHLRAADAPAPGGTVPGAEPMGAPAGATEPIGLGFPRWCRRRRLGLDP